MGQTTAKYELTQVSVRDCSDVGKMALSDEDECKKAASELSLKYFGAGSYSHNPKGCSYLANFIVLWNTHKTGSNRPDSKAICKNHGKNTTTQYFPCHQMLISSIITILSIEWAGFIKGTPGDGTTVSCGNHEAATCSECPQGNGAAWCNGDCTWQDDECVSPGEYIALDVEIINF